MFSVFFGFFFLVRMFVAWSFFFVSVVVGFYVYIACFLFFGLGFFYLGEAVFAGFLWLFFFMAGLVFMMS